MGVNASKHLAFTTCLRNVGVIRNHADRIFGVSGIASDGDGKDQLLVDIAKYVTPVNSVIRENAIEHVFVTIKERLQRTADIVCSILDREEWEEDHHLDDLGTGELAVGFLFESHLPFCDVYGSQYVHYPLYTESTATFREKIVQLRNYLSIFVHARCIFLFGHFNILKITEITKDFKDFQPSFFVNTYLRNLNLLKKKHAFIKKDKLFRLFFT